jgi:transketolase
MRMKNVAVALLFLMISSSCSGVKMITPNRKLAEKVDTSKLYKQSFLQKMNEVKEKFRSGKADVALKELTSMKEEGLSTAERSTRKNLIGVLRKILRLSPKFI